MDAEAAAYVASLSETRRALLRKLDRATLGDELKTTGLKTMGMRMKVQNILLSENSARAARPDGSSSVAQAAEKPKAAVPSVLDSIDPFAAAAPSLSAAISAASSELDDDRALELRELRSLPPETGMLWSWSGSLTRRAQVPTEHLGIALKDGGLHPIKTQSLSRWQPTDGHVVPPAPTSGTCDGPRLCVAAMLRAAPLPSIDGFLRYYHAIGFELIILFFDKPEEDAAGIELAEAHHAEVGGVEIHKCDEAWWAAERVHGRSFVRARHVARTQSQAKATGEKDTETPMLWAYGEASIVQMFEETADVQTRQSLVMSRASTDAWSRGYDWLLQLDIDELLYFPRASERYDARRFFGSIAPDVDTITFHNHEVMPCEALEAPDWFADCTLFKVSPHLLCDFEGSELEVLRQQKIRRFEEGEDLDPYKLAERAETSQHSSALWNLTRPFGLVRARAIRKLHEMGLKLPDRDKANEDALEARKAQLYRQISSDDQKRAAFWGGKKGESTSTSSTNGGSGDENESDAKFKVARGGAGGGWGGGLVDQRDVRRECPEMAEVRMIEAIEAEQKRREERKKKQASSTGAAADPLHESCVEAESVGRTYFNAHSQGKMAARLRRVPPNADGEYYFLPPAGGVHGFGTEGASSGTTKTCVGAHDPCVLHYANCGFSYWIRKYEVLGDIPNFEDRQSVEGFEKHRRGKAAGGEADGSWSAHLAARDLVVRGLGGGTKANRPALELFYRTLIMGNEHNEAQRLAAAGCLVRIRGVASLLRSLRSADNRHGNRRRRTAIGPPSLPTPWTLTPAVWMANRGLERFIGTRRRHTLWRVVFDKPIVCRARPSTTAIVSDCFQPGQLIWSEAPRGDGWVRLTDRGHGTYVLIDATPLGLSLLLEKVEPPELDEGACTTCLAAPCRCAVLASYGR